VTQGAGYGAIESVRLRILLLVDPRLSGLGASVARALGGRHQVERVGDTGSGLGSRWFASLTAARAASSWAPHLLHAIGSEGAARAVGPVAAGLGRPFVLTLDEESLVHPSGRLRRAMLSAAAVVVPRREIAERVRELGIERELYVTSFPDPGPSEEDRFFLGSIEVVYGRIVAERRVDLSDAAPIAPLEGSDRLVQLGPKKS
jgi:hypothetical protein